MINVQQKSATIKLHILFETIYTWWRGLDLNQRPFGYEPNELPGCSTPR